MKRICLLISVLVVSLTLPVQAADQEVINEIRAMKDRIAELEVKVALYEHEASLEDEFEVHDHQDHSNHQDHSDHYDHHGHSEHSAHEHHEQHSQKEWVIKGGHGQHAHLDASNIQIHGGLDYRFIDSQDENKESVLHEAEIGFGAKLNDWMDASVTFTKHDGEEVEIEEAYGLIKFEDLNSQIKFGKFFVNFGPENRVGFFDRRTITPSAMREGFFGEENWSDEGAEFTYRLPARFYSTVSVSVLNGNNDNTFGDEVAEATVDNDSFVVAINSTNEVDFSWGTASFGASYAQTKWDANDQYDVHLFGIDAGAKVGNFEVQAEYMFSNKENAPATDELDDSGFNIWGAYVYPVDMKYVQEIEFLFAYSKFDPDAGTATEEYGPQISFKLNDYSKARLMYQVRKEKPTEVDNNRFIGQFSYHF